MTRTQALKKAIAMFGIDAFVEDRRKRKPGLSLAGKCVVGERGDFGFGLIRGWGDDWEKALEHANRKA